MSSDLLRWMLCSIAESPISNGAEARSSSLKAKNFKALMTYPLSIHSTDEEFLDTYELVLQCLENNIIAESCYRYSKGVLRSRLAEAMNAEEGDRYRIMKMDKYERFINRSFYHSVN